jgi:hypothetical protein
LPNARTPCSDPVKFAAARHPSRKLASLPRKLAMPSAVDPLFKLRRDLAASLADKRLLYLDLLYWNYLCDAALGESRNPDHEALLSELRIAVGERTVVCPVEFTTFLELHKQRIPEKRRMTARLIDELSGAVAIISPPERCLLESLRFAQATLAKAELSGPPRDEIWTKAAFLIGHGELKSKNAPPADQENLNGVIRARLWDMGFTEVVDQLGTDSDISFEWAERTANHLNCSKVEARSGFTSFRAVYRAEVRGILDVSASPLGNAMRYLFYRAGGDADGVSDEQRDESGKQFAQLLAAAFEKQDLSKQLPSIHVPAMLYASMQWDGSRRYKANDIQDFGHASAALGYCDAFATERPLAELLRQAKLTQDYGTTILSSIGQVRAWLSPQGA